MTLNCSGVRLDNRKVFCTPGPWTKPFERIFYRSINNLCEKFLVKQRLRKVI